MKFPDEVVEKVARSICSERLCNPEVTDESAAKAALSTITLQDIAKLPEVKELVEALEAYANEANWYTPDDGSANKAGFMEVGTYGGEGFEKAQKALAPFTEASNG